MTPQASLATASYPDRIAGILAAAGNPARPLLVRRPPGKEPPKISPETVRALWGSQIANATPNPGNGMI